ncbi:MAG: HPr(Ser) kinase/phosphatase [Ruminococcaceae bacterium]|nr:HPr(Ser) kinase/phosphatase [Oscillospiraceae bacterium]
MQEFTVKLSKIISEFKLEEVYVPKPDILIGTNEVNRPGLQIAGFFDYFDSSRLQIIGMVENTYLTSLKDEERFQRVDELLSKKSPAIVITREIEVLPEIIELAKKYGVNILRTSLGTSSFMSALIAFLNIELAPRITRHGVLVEVYGEGILILGESGIGKSEAAVELMKRGHRLVADDAVEIRRVSSKTLVGSSPEIIRHFIEMRGIGIIDVKKIFGMGAVKDTEKIDLVIQLEVWQKGKQYDRLGLADNYTEILGIDIPSLTIPIRPGRNLAVILEIAAMNNRQRRMGYNAAEELNSRLMEQMGAEDF